MPRTVVLSWLFHITAKRDTVMGEVVTRMRKRRDAPNFFSTKTRMREYMIVKMGLAPYVMDTCFADLWKSYRQYLKNRVKL